MLVRDVVRRWLRLPSGVALLLGLGALSASDARGDAPQNRQPGTVASGDLVIRAGADGVSIAEGGQDFAPLRLGDTPEAWALRRLLVEHGSAGARIGPTQLAGGGGSGFSWAPAPTRPKAGAPARSVPADPIKPAPSDQTRAPGGNPTTPDKQG